MASDDDFDDILPEARIFDSRVDDIWNEKMEAYEDLYHKNEENVAESETNELLQHITQNKKAPNVRKNKRGKKGASVPDKDENKSPPKVSRRTSPRKKATTVNDDIEKEELVLPGVKLDVFAKRRLKKLQLETERDTRRIDKETKQILSSFKSCDKKREDIELIDEDIPEEEVTLKIRYMSNIFKVTVGEREVFKSIFKKVADAVKLNPTEILLCLEDKNIGILDTPSSLKLKFFQIIDCFPYKSKDISTDESAKKNKLLIKIQSNDTRKKTELYIHKLEKFKQLMDEYSALRNIPLKDLKFEFDGEKIDGSETPADLDMESESCIDVRVLNFKEPISKKVIKTINVKPMKKSDMLDICVLD